MRLDYPELMRDQTKSLSELEDCLSELRFKREKGLLEKPPAKSKGLPPLVNKRPPKPKLKL